MKSRHEDGVPNSVDFLVSGMAAKITASTVTYPTQVLRSRLQLRDVETDKGSARPYSSLRGVLTSLLKAEGMRGLYKGLVPNTLRVLPSAAITFWTYETALKLLT